MNQDFGMVESNSSYANQKANLVTLCHYVNKYYVFKKDYVYNIIFNIFLKI